jgi:hypothetical protein
MRSIAHGQAGRDRVLYGLSGAQTSTGLIKK